MKNQGFTLIELVVVIVILGILAATAAPKFINLTAVSYTAILEGVKGSMSSASEMVHAKSIVKGNQGEISSTVNIGDGQGDTLPVIYGYPDAQEGTWARLLDINYGDDPSDTDTDYTFLNVGTGSSSRLIIYPTANGAPQNINTGNCFIQYSVSTEENIFPDIKLVECE